MYVDVCDNIFSLAHIPLDICVCVWYVLCGVLTRQKFPATSFEKRAKKPNPKNMSISCQKHTHIRKPTFGTRIRTQTQCRMSHFCTHRITDYSVICCSAQRGNMNLCELYLTPTAQCTSATVMLTFHSPQKQLQEVLVPVGIAEYDYLYSCCWLPT